MLIIPTKLDTVYGIGKEEGVPVQEKPSGELQLECLLKKFLNNIVTPRRWLMWNKFMISKQRSRKLRRARITARLSS